MRHFVSRGGVPVHVGMIYHLGEREPAREHRAGIIGPGYVIRVNACNTS